MLNKIEIVDESTLFGIGMMAALVMKGYDGNGDLAVESAKFVYDVLQSWDDAQAEFDDMASAINKKNRQGFLDSFVSYTESENDLIDALEDVSEVFSHTNFSFDQDVSDIDTMYEELDSFTDGNKLMGLFTVPAEVAEAKKEREDKNKALKQMREDFEALQDDLDDVQADMAVKIFDFYDLSVDVRLQTALNEIKRELDSVKAEEADTVKTLKKLKKQKGRASKKERTRINKQRAKYQDELLDIQSRIPSLSKPDVEELTAIAEEQNATAAAALKSARAERERLLKEQKELLSEIDEATELLRNSGLGLILNTDENGDTEALQQFLTFEGKRSNVYDAAKKKLKSLAKLIKNEQKTLKPLSINVPYLDACLLLHNYSKKDYPLTALRTFLQRALLGQRCLSRKDWNDSNMMDKSYWDKKIKEVRSFYDGRYGSHAIIAEAIIDQTKKTPPNFQAYLKDPKRLR
jgi:hypothetical protein